jgi:PAS domain-containing protein
VNEVADGDEMFSAGNLGSGPDERLFRAHFENLPGPAYIWRRFGDDFELIAHNKAAGTLPESSGADFLGASARALQGEYVAFLPLLHRCVDTVTVLREEIDYRYKSGTSKRLVVTLIPVTPDILVQHTEDITARYVAD